MSASVPLVISNGNGNNGNGNGNGNGITPQDSAVETLLERPNPQWTGHALQYFIAASIAVSNKAYLLRVRGAGNTTQELWPLGVKEVTPIYDLGTRLIKEFQVQWGSEIKKFPVGPDGDSDVIYLRRPSLNKETDRSPAHVAAAPAEVFTRVLQRCADIVSNSSNITGVLSTESEMGKDAVQKIKDKINQFKTGSRESGGTLVTANAKWNLTRLSEDPASALSVAIKDSLARDVCMTFGVPTQLVGLPGTDTYNNIALARVGFITDTILPAYIQLYISALNHALMRNGARIVPDIEQIPAMITARQQMTELAAKATMLSLNEQRKLLGYPEYEGHSEIGDVYGIDADTPVKLLDLIVKIAAIQAQAGGVSNLLGGTPT
jgi:phage portal protein BeeE